VLDDAACGTEAKELREANHKLVQARITYLDRKVRAVQKAMQEDLQSVITDARAAVKQASAAVADIKEWQQRTAAAEARAVAAEAAAQAAQQEAADARESVQVVSSQCERMKYAQLAFLTSLKSCIQQALQDVEPVQWAETYVDATLPDTQWEGC
jgi:chromosome segregation ATPase